MRVLDLFSGIGGISLALERSGFVTKQFVEIDKHAQEILKKHWPDVPIHEDITTLQIKEDQYDVICGGFPCQDISVAGTGKGLEGERSGLWKEFNRLIKQGKPKYVLIENSPNLRNRGLEVVLKDLWESGYDSEWYCLEAGQFGASHVRERIVIIAYPNGTRRERLVKDEYLEEVRQGKRCSEEDIKRVFDNPFGRSDCWPQPLLRRGDDGVSRRVDRLKRLGNSVYVPMFEFIGKCMEREYGS